MNWEELKKELIACVYLASWEPYGDWENVVINHSYVEKPDKCVENPDDGWTCWECTRCGWIYHFKLSEDGFGFSETGYINNIFNRVSDGKDFCERLAMYRALS